jgi:beta-ribofuranosylaminobenzene 5'-phosphate synthase
LEGSGIKVTITTPSRLHFSIVDMRGDLGRIHGSVGVAIQEPKIVLKASPAKTMKAMGPRANRVLEFAGTILRDSGVDMGIEFEVLSDIPEHQGFGSGTQLALAVGSAVSQIYDLGLSVEDIAMKLSRSKISGIGTQAFKHGGFIVDGGHRTDEPNSIPPLIFHHDIPEDWLFVVGVPEISQNVSGEIEKKAFSMFEPPPESLVGEVARLVLVKMIPSIIDADIKAFGEAMTAIDYKFGEYWLKVQGGRYSHPLIEAGVGFLLNSGSYGAGQSSWGPAFYGLVEGERQAELVREKLNKFLNSEGRRGSVFCTRPNNEGAKIRITS